ncbi:MAG: protein kinase, partial [Myxococcota bacterium]|nr:protein kinase [Myxococcota bacterium]
MEFDAEGAAGVRAGDVLAGKYRVERVLGVGGMGVVVAAHHLQLDDRVALKFLLPAALGNPDAIARFAREARAVVKIKSEHVARVIDVGTLESGAPFIVMEFLEGRDLAAWLRQCGPLPVEQAVDFVLQASEAIAEAHALGIVHRDLKPANLFVVRGPDGLPSIKVLDFGISKLTALGALGPDLATTKTSTIMGSPFYMSPEQMRTPKDVNAQADIWALGVILFELLSGQPPFVGDTFAEVCTKITVERPTPLRRLRPDAPARLEAALGRCLEKDRARRYGNVAELAHALREFAPEGARPSVDRITRIIAMAGLAPNALGPASSPDGAASDVSPSHETQTIAPLGRTTQGTKTGKVALAFVAVACALGLASTLVFAVARRGATKQADPVAVPSAPAGLGGVQTTPAENRAEEPSLPRLAAPASPPSPTAEAAPPPDPSTWEIASPPGRPR